MALPYTRTEVKDRVRPSGRVHAMSHCRPSRRSFDALNAKAIEHDVRLGAKMGYLGDAVASECGTTFKEYRAVHGDRRRQRLPKASHW